MSYVTSLMSGTPSPGTMHSFLHSDTTYLYFFIFLWSSSRRDTTLRRSTSTECWFSGRTPNLHRLWAQASCRKQATHWRQAFCRRQGSCRTQGFIRVKPLSFHQSITASTYDSGVRALRRSLLSRTWTISKFVLCWFHHCTCIVYHSVKENLMSSPSQDPKSTARPVCVVFKKKRLNQDVFRQKIFPQNMNRFGETMNRYSATKSTLMGWRWWINVKGVCNWLCSFSWSKQAYQSGWW